ncbi:hypothetical protein JCM3766R1_006577 [Sporobolomyces carnicolor]
MDPVTHQSLSSLLKHYAALTPSTASLIPSTDQGGPFPRCDTLSLAATQQWFVDHLIPLVRDRRGESSETSHERAWRKGFWKRVVNGIEQGFQDRIRRDSNGQESVQDEEVHAEILETMVEYFSSSTGPNQSDGLMSERTYFWGNIDSHAPARDWHRITTREESRMISGGTTGLRTWQACIALSNHFLVDRGPFILPTSQAERRKKKVVELGAGVGLLSLVAATILDQEEASRSQTPAPSGKQDSPRPRIDFGTVISTDVDERVLELLDSNVRLNRLENRIKTTKLDWELAWRLDAGQGGDASEASSDKREAEEARAALVDWERQAFGVVDSAEDDQVERHDHAGADLVIGADIVYDPSLTAPLAATIAWLLRPRTSCRSQGVARAEFASDPRRDERQAIIAGTIRNETTWELFLSECRSRWLRVEQVELEQSRDGSGLVGAEGWEGEGIVRVVRLTL